MLYSRITTPTGSTRSAETWADYVPRTDNSQWRAYLNSLAPRRRRPHRRTRRADGPQPAQVGHRGTGARSRRSARRTEWCRDAGRVTAYRELRGHDDRPKPRTGTKPGQVRSSSPPTARPGGPSAAGSRREQLRLSTRQLRMRVRAYERELAAAPACRQRARRHPPARPTTPAPPRYGAHEPTPPLARRTGPSSSATPPVRHHSLHCWQPAPSSSEIDDARGHWLVHAAQTRVQADLSRAELSARRRGRA
ncbi:hypothetical protein HBB16_13225 [Pseudonocardia sp. MCCB 268]|nr:hypothetical protein [Pseudonocardia cytotoxica]